MFTIEITHTEVSKIFCLISESLSLKTQLFTRPHGSMDLMNNKLIWCVLLFD